MYEAGERANKTILVTGATGNQGGAVARQLLKEGWQVRAATRNPSGSAARALAAREAEVVRADYEDSISLIRALEGVHGVFSVQNMFGVGVARETQWGILLAELAADAKIQHFIYTSVGGADRNSGVPHFESKWRIESRIRELGIPHTILRPVFFADNLVVPGIVSFLIWSGLAGALGRRGRIQMISVDDIGGFAALAFAEPERYLGQAIEIAGDEMGLEDAAEIYQKVTGKRPFYLPIPPWALRRIDRGLGLMLQWFRDAGYQADIASLREFNPELKRLEPALRAAWERRVGSDSPTAGPGGSGCPHR